MSIRRQFPNRRTASSLVKFLERFNDWNGAQRFNALNTLSSEQHDGTSGTVGTGFVFEILMELLHRCSGPEQRMIVEQFGGLDEDLVSRDRRTIREKIETESKIRKWFQDLTTLII